MTSSPFSGFINLNKPLSWTSHDCVARIRRLLNTKKVGHGGTLDPLATGVLPVAIGRATRLLQYLPASKTYQAVVRFGITTTTDDLEGDVLTQQSAAHLQSSAVAAALPQFIGAQSQVPPLYSAIQVNGKRLYDLARQGRAADVPARQVTIHQLVSQGWRAGDRPELTVAVDCGPGTYIRSLARDLGEAMGTGATLAALVRTSSSGFELAESITLAELETAITRSTFTPLSAERSIGHLAAIALPAPLARRWRMGQKLALDQVIDSGIDPDQLPKSPGSPMRVMDAATADFLGIGEIRLVPPISELSPVAAQQPVQPMPDSDSLSPVLVPKMVFSPIS